MNIFIYGLNFKARREDLIDLFSPYGEVTSARIIINRETRRSRGYGFVEMADDDAGKAAIAALNGIEHMDRVINVAIANERPPRNDA
ncbi:MAG: RNA-binding protein [Bacteroidales bacterium]|jgi:RNA recognition motif-containing protein|nr:RNA-binding protein [Bacteroidales bacterium]